MKRQSKQTFLLQAVPAQNESSLPGALNHDDRKKTEKQPAVS